MSFERGQAVRLVDGVDAKLRGEIGVVLGVCRDGGTRGNPAKPYVVIGWGRHITRAASAYALSDVVSATAERAAASEGELLKDVDAGSAEPFCACGRRFSQCDRSRRGCTEAARFYRNTLATTLRGGQ